MRLADFQRRLITTLLDIHELRGFALAGGWALNAHHVLDCPPRDIHLFTPDSDQVPTAAASAEQVLQAHGLRVDRVTASHEPGQRLRGAARVGTSCRIRGR